MHSKLKLQRLSQVEGNREKGFVFGPLADDLGRSFCEDAEIDFPGVTAGARLPYRLENQHAVRTKCVCLPVLFSRTRGPPRDRFGNKQSRELI
jgi:hypothetical protein